MKSDADKVPEMKVEPSGVSYIEMRRAVLPSTFMSGDSAFVMLSPGSNYDAVVAGRIIKNPPW
jgi:hypothetical protein